MDAPGTGSEERPLNGAAPQMLCTSSEPGLVLLLGPQNRAGGRGGQPDLGVKPKLFSPRSSAPQLVLSPQGLGVPSSLHPYNLPLPASPQPCNWPVPRAQLSAAQDAGARGDTYGRSRVCPRGCERREPARPRRGRSPSLELLLRPNGLQSL